MGMRHAALLLLLVAHAASADPYKLVEDVALGAPLPADHTLLGGKELDRTLSTCITGAPAAAGSVVFWAEASKAGQVTRARVHGTGSSALDSCLQGALGRAAIADKLDGPVIIVGRMDIADKSHGGGFLPSAKLSNIAVMFDPKGAAWQLTINRLGYTANRAADIAQAFDARAADLAACAGKLTGSPKGTEIHALAFTDGNATVRGSGTPAYDSCIEGVLAQVKLPARESAMWIELVLKQPAEALAPRNDKPALTREQSLVDALTTAVRSRKLTLLTCLDGHPKATLTKVGIALGGGKASITSVATGDARADACVKGKLEDVAIPNATPSDKLALDVTLDPQ